MNYLILYSWKPVKQFLFKTMVTMKATVSRAQYSLSIKKLLNAPKEVFSSRKYHPRPWLKHESRGFSQLKTSELSSINPVPIKRNARRSRPYNKCAASPPTPQKLIIFHHSLRKYDQLEIFTSRYI